MRRVFIITGLRIQALHLTTSADFTYSKGYIGLLSVLGALLSIIFCCVPSIYGLINLLGARRRDRLARIEEQVVNEPTRPRTLPLATEAQTVNGDTTATPQKPPQIHLAPYKHLKNQVIQEISQHSSTHDLGGNDLSYNEAGNYLIPQEWANNSQELDEQAPLHSQQGPVDQKRKPRHMWFCRIIQKASLFLIFDIKILRFFPAPGALHTVLDLYS